MRTYGPNHWNPPRVASCPCGWSAFGTLSSVNRAAEEHLVEGTEGCDHAIAIETLTRPGARP